MQSFAIEINHDSALLMGALHLFVTSLHVALRAAGHKITQPVVSNHGINMIYMHVIPSHTHATPMTRERAFSVRGVKYFTMLVNPRMTTA
jgi:hypothetical protein